MAQKLEVLNIAVVSYCEIPEKIAENHEWLEENKCDSYVKHEITLLEERKKYTDNWDLDDWILKNYPKQVKPGDSVLIHLDY